MSATPPTGPPSSLATQGAATPFPSIAFAKAKGAVPGDVLSAPLAPATGPIEGKAESLVVVTVKNFFDSPTGKAVVAILSASAFAVLVTFGAALIGVWTSGKSLLDAGAIDWRATERVCEIAGGTALVAGIMGYFKKHDNNVTKS